MDAGRAVAVVGTALVLASLVVLYLASPWYVTSVVSTEPADGRTADRPANATVDERGPIAFSDLSPAEQAALRSAARSPTDRYVDRGASGQGPTFDYDNDVTNSYSVERDGTVYGLSVYVDVDWVFLPLSLVGGLGGGVLLVGGTCVSYRQ